MSDVTDATLCRLLKTEQGLMQEKTEVKNRIKAEKTHQDLLQSRWKDIVRATEPLQKDLQLDIPALRQAASALASSEPILTAMRRPTTPVAAVSDTDSPSATPKPALRGDTGADEDKMDES